MKTEHNPESGGNESDNNVSRRQYLGFAALVTLAGSPKTADLWGGWWPFDSGGKTEEDQETTRTGDGVVFVTDDPNADPTEENGDVVFYV